MPNYTFELWDGYDPIGDEVGVILTDRADAYQYAQDVVRELMIGREAQTRTWRLDVYENRAERVFEIPFASLAETLDRPHPALRVAMEGILRPEPFAPRGGQCGPSHHARITSPWRSLAQPAFPDHEFRQANDQRRLGRRHFIANP